MPAPAPLTDLLLTGRFRSSPSYQMRRPHGTGDWLLILTTAGAGRFTTNAPPAPNSRLSAAVPSYFDTAPADLTLYPAATPQDYGTAPNAPVWGMLWVHVRPRIHWLPWLEWPQRLPGLRHVKLTPRNYIGVRAALTDMHRRATAAPDPRGRDLAMTSLERALLFASEDVPGSTGSSIDPRIIRTLETLSAMETAVRPDLDALARQAGLSLSRLQHLFRQKTGKTILEFTEDRRIDRARRLLAGTNLSVKEIAHACGFASPFYFSLRFKSATGKAPLHWRHAR